MRRSLALAVCPLLSASLALAAPGVTTSNVNFRSGPGTSNSSLGVLAAGTPVEIVACDEGGIWCSVEANGQSGFVSGNYLQETAPAVSEPPGTDIVEPGGDIVGPNDDLFSDAELDELVAPIALYPDSLLTQVLVASTAPLDVVKAQRWVEANKDLPADQREAAAAAEGWDESVAVLATGFPDVIETMAKDLDWTQDLGDAVVLQNDDLLDAVQRQRARAQAVGNLETNQAQVVTVQDNSISIAPAKPDVVYVPQYNPVTTYTTPAPAAPVYVETYDNSNNFDAGAVLATGAIAFGTGLAISSVFNDNWGYRDYWYGPRNIEWTQNNIYPRPVRPIRPGPPDWHGRPGQRPGPPDWHGRPGERPGWSDRPDRPGQRPDAPWRPDDRRRDEARRQIKAERQAGGRLSDGQRRPGAQNRPAAGNRPAGSGGQVNRQAMESKLKSRSNNPPKASRPDAGNRQSATRKAGASRPSGAVSRPKSSGTQAKKAASRGKSSTQRAAASRPKAQPKKISKPKAAQSVKRRPPQKSSAFNRSSGGHRVAASSSRGRVSRGGGGRRGGGGGGRGGRR